MWFLSGSIDLGLIHRSALGEFHNEEENKEQIRLESLKTSENLDPALGKNTKEFWQMCNFSYMVAHLSLRYFSVFIALE